MYDAVNVCNNYKLSVKMSERRISLGINVSIIVILTIFGVLLSLPLRLLLTTHYYDRNETISENNTIKKMENVTVETTVIPVDYRKLKRCPVFGYRERLISTYRCNYYDMNCTYTERIIKDDKMNDKGKIDNVITSTEDVNVTLKISKEEVGENMTENVGDNGKNRRTKSVPVAVHILMTMLLISAIAAFVEVLRIRFARDKDSSKAGSASSRKTSTVELSVRWQFPPRQRSFEMQGMHRSALRLLGARPPPLIRRSSFPTQPSKQSSGTIGGTPNNRVSRRRSAESDEELGFYVSSIHHRTRLIRRH
ncbi:hypothetical protein ANTRET_LOCUS5128 [Anthophora retusa]